MLENHQRLAAFTLSRHLDVTNPQFVSRYQLISYGLSLLHGFPKSVADQKALALLNGMVQQQAAVLAFDYAFYLVGLLFVISLPLALLLRAPRHTRRAPEQIVHAE